MINRINTYSSEIVLWTYDIVLGYHDATIKALFCLFLAYKHLFFYLERMRIQYCLYHNIIYHSTRYRKVLCPVLIVLVLHKNMTKLFCCFSKCKCIGMFTLGGCSAQCCPYALALVKYIVKVKADFHFCCWQWQFTFNILLAFFVHTISFLLQPFLHQPG